VIGVAQLGAGTIGIAVKPWVKVTDYVAAGGELNLAIVEKLRAAGVDYPMSARNVRLINP